MILSFARFGNSVCLLLLFVFTIIITIVVVVVVVLLPTTTERTCTTALDYWTPSAESWHDDCEDYDDNGGHHG